jgi:hypothetical protein
MCLDPSNIRSLVTSGSDSAAQDASLRRGVRPHPHASEPVVSLITWRPQAWERRLSLRVDSRSQGSAAPTRGTFVVRDNRLAISVQPHFFDSGSAAAAGGQERAGHTLFVRLDTGGGTVEDFESNGCARRARKLCGAAHWGGDLRAGEKVRERSGVAGARARRISRTGDARGSSSSRCP